MKGLKVLPAGHPLRLRRRRPCNSQPRSVRPIESLEPRWLLSGDPLAPHSDHYLVPSNRSFTVPAETGLLANDTKVDTAVSAVLVEPATHGLIDLSGNGSFKYQPTDGFTGTDRFRYRLQSGETESSATTVTLVIEHPQPMRLRPRGDSVVTFNELMYFPLTNEESEWLELHNQMSVDIDLSGWKLSGGVNYLFNTGTVLPAGGYLAVASKPDVVAFEFGLDQVFGPFEGRLSNAGEEIRLVNNGGRMMDVLDYEDEGDWPVGADGSGATLAKRRPNAATSDPTSWVASPSLGGTPGRPNFGDVEPRRMSLLPPSSRATVHVPQDDSLDTRWTDPEFDDSTWTRGNQPVWFDTSAPRGAPGFNSLRAYWTFDGDFADATGNGHTGHPTGTRFDDDTPDALGKGQSIRLNGESDFVSAVVDVSETSYTASLWFRADIDEVQNPSQLNRGLFSVVTTDLATQANNDRQIFFRNGNVSARVWFSETIGSRERSLTDGEWHHVVHVLGQDVGGQRIYVDGQLAAEGIKDTADIFAQTRINIGFAYSSRRRFYQGWVDDVSLWDEAISAEAVQALYKGISPLSLPSYRTETGIEISHEMADRQTSAYVRSEFVANAQLYDQLQLKVNYDDGFVAHLNGVRVTQVNAPLEPLWNASAATSRPRHDVVRPEIIDLTPHLELLRTGTNVLAVHALNSSVSDEAFLISAELFGRVREFVPLSAELMLSELSAAGGADFSVELVNRGLNAMSLEGFVLRSSEGDGKEYVFPHQMIEPEAYHTVPASQHQFSPSEGDRVFLYAPTKRQLLDAVTINPRPQARGGEGRRRWQFPALATPNAANQFDFSDEIVINEIHYHDRPFYATQNLPFIESPTEWIELYNRSPRTVDLSGWTLTSGVQFTFPAETILHAGQFLVVSNDAAALSLDVPNDNILGNFAGALNNKWDTLRLLDQKGNLADEVTYFDRGRWPAYADGGGSTLELRDPFADNQQPENWAASNERQSAAWQTIAYRGVVADDGFSAPRSQLYHELVFGLLDAGELLIDDISVIEDPDGARRERIQNGSFDQDKLGGPARTWRIEGNHQGIVVRDPDDSENQVLYLLASGPFETRLNHAETTFDDQAQIEVGKKYEVFFRAKWLAGSPQLNTHLFFNHLAKTTILEMPHGSGTPGAENSQFAGNLGPNYRELQHRPIVPEAEEAVVVEVVADDPQEIAVMTLWFAVNGGVWQNVDMLDVGSHQYRGTIPGQPASNVVQFYVEGVDTAGAVSQFPAAGPEARALYKVQDGQALNELLQNLRIIMTPGDAAKLHEETNASSNARLGATVISNGSEVFYDVGVRLRGSSANRPDNLFLGFNLQFDPMRLFRGVHDTVGIDRSGRSRVVTRGQDEIVVKHIANHAGVPFMFDDLVHVITPDSKHTRTALLLLARYGDIFLDSQFANGSDGTVFKLDMAYIPSTVSEDPESAKTPVHYTHPLPAKDLEDLGNDKELYRPHLLIRNNRSADNYGKIIAVSQALSLDEETLSEVATTVIDVDQWARTFAVQSLVGPSDTYTRTFTGGNTNHHNIVFYAPLDDAPVLALPWDWDIAFALSPKSPLIGPYSNTSKLLNLPANRRLVYGHLLDIIQTTFNNDYLDPWIDHYAEVAGQSFRAIKPYVTKRTDFVRSKLPAFVPFEITTESGENFDIDEARVTLEGRGWIDVGEIRLAGSELPLEVTWTDEQTWQLSLPLAPDTHPVVLQAFDFSGNLVGEDVVTITSTGGARPLQDSLRVSEIHFHPPPPTATEVLAGYLDSDDFEFLELVNIGSEPLDLTNVQLVQVNADNPQGVVFAFDGSAVTTLPAGGRVLIVEDLDAFRFRYGSGLPVAGQWRGGLSNAGEQLTLIADGAIIQQFAYNDQWHPTTDGQGASLEVINPENPDLNLWASATAWRPSTQLGGSPGTAGVRGDVNGDDIVNVTDIDRLQEEIRSGTHSSLFDLTADGQVDQADLDELVQNILQTQEGDINLDGIIDSEDFVQLFANYGRHVDSWADGDLDGDGDVDFRDFNQLAIGFMSADIAAAATKRVTP